MILNLLMVVIVQVKINFQSSLVIPWGYQISVYHNFACSYLRMYFDFAHKWCALLWFIVIYLRNLFAFDIFIKLWHSLNISFLLTFLYLQVAKITLLFQILLSLILFIQLSRQLKLLFFFNFILTYFHDIILFRILRIF